MSAHGPNPDLVAVGQSPEWKAWFDEALAYVEDQRLFEVDWPQVMISDESLTKIREAEEHERIKREFSPLIRTAARDYAIGIHPYPWDFRA